MKRTLLTILALILSVSTFAACESSSDSGDSSPAIYEMTAEDLAAMAKITPGEFAGSVLGLEVADVIDMIEDNGKDGTPESELSDDWRVMYNNATAQEMTLDLSDGRYNLIVEKGIVIGIIVEQLESQDIAVGVTTPDAIAQAHGHSHDESFQTPEVDELGSDGKPLNLDCASMAFNGPVEMCSSENWE